MNERSKTITEIPSPFEDTVPNKYSVLMLSDLHLTRKTGKKAFDYLESLKETDSMPSFALVLGDIADTGCKRLCGIRILCYKTSERIWDRKSIRHNGKP